MMRIEGWTKPLRTRAACRDERWGGYEHEQEHEHMNFGNFRNSGLSITNFSSGLFVSPSHFEAH